MLIKNHVALRDATLAPSKSLTFIRLALGLGLAVTSVVTSLPALAGRPILTDDATIVDNCQLENWAERQGGANTFWAVPACRAFGVEWGIGIAKTPDGEPQQYAFAAKTEVKALQSNSYGITTQLAYQFAADARRDGDWRLNLAYTQSLADDAVLIHANLGRMQRNSAENDWVGGVALQYAVQENHWVFAELYRENAGRPLYQVGYLAEVISERLQLDISYSNRLSRSGREDLITAGFVFYFSAF